MLTPKQRREIAAGGNRLKAQFTIGGELPADSVVAHVQRALAASELVKIRVNSDDRDDCRSVVESLAERAGADVVQIVGRVALLYRAKEEKKADGGGDDGVAEQVDSAGGDD